MYVCTYVCIYSRKEARNTSITETAIGDMGLASVSMYVCMYLCMYVGDMRLATACIYACVYVCMYRAEPQR
jgi:hypothetical protein